MKLIKWFANFLEDQEGGASSKRLTLYISLYYLYLLISGSMNNKPIDQTVLMALIVIILFCLGAITSEFFKNGLPAVITKSTITKSTTNTKGTTTTNIPAEPNPCG